MNSPAALELIAPARLAVIRTVAVERQARAAHGHDVGRERRILGVRGAVVARAGDEGYSGYIENAVISSFIRREDSSAPRGTPSSSTRRTPPAASRR